MLRSKRNIFNKDEIFIPKQNFTLKKKGKILILNILGIDQTILHKITYDLNNFNESESDWIWYQIKLNIKGYNFNKKINEDMI